MASRPHPDQRYSRVSGAQSSMPCHKGTRRLYPRSNPQNHPLYHFFFPHIIFHLHTYSLSLSLSLKLIAFYFLYLQNSFLLSKDLRSRITKTKKKKKANHMMIEFVSLFFGCIYVYLGKHMVSRLWFSVYLLLDRGNCGRQYIDCVRGRKGREREKGG